jgi:hypothetical protein
MPNFTDLRGATSRATASIHRVSIRTARTAHSLYTVLGELPVDPAQAREGALSGVGDRQCWLARAVDPWRFEINGTDMASDASLLDELLVGPAGMKLGVVDLVSRVHAADLVTAQ